MKLTLVLSRAKTIEDILEALDDVKLLIAEEYKFRGIKANGSGHFGKVTDFSFDLENEEGESK